MMQVLNSQNVLYNFPFVQDDGIVLCFKNYIQNWLAFLTLLGTVAMHKTLSIFNKMFFNFIARVYAVDPTACIFLKEKHGCLWLHYYSFSNGLNRVESNGTNSDSDSTLYEQRNQNW